MSFDSRRESENPEHRRIQTLADEAIALAKDLDLTRDPSVHISRALRGIPEGPERNRLFGQIRSELKRRGFKTPQEQQKENDRILREARDQILLEDAYNHEARIDPHERDEDGEEAA